MRSRSGGERGELTGLPGRDEFLRALDQGIAEAREAGGSVSLGLTDIDMFRELNERHGDAAGDALLKALTAHLMEAAPEGGALYRCGGDEFMLLMPGVDKESAFLLLEQARRDFEGERELTAAGHVITIRASISGGVAAFPEDGATSQELARKADDAMYRSKAGGRSKVSLAREERMVTKTSHYTQGQLDRLSDLAKREGLGEAVLLREALDDLLRKYSL